MKSTLCHVWVLVNIVGFCHILSYLFFIVHCAFCISHLLSRHLRSTANQEGKKYWTGMVSKCLVRFFYLSFFFFSVSVSLSISLSSYFHHNFLSCTLRNLIPTPSALPFAFARVSLCSFCLFREQFWFNLNRDIFSGIFFSRALLIRSISLHLFTILLRCTDAGDVSSMPLPAACIYLCFSGVAFWLTNHFFILYIILVVSRVG